MSKLDKAFEAIRDSEAFQQLKAKYDELDNQAKLYVNLGAVGAGVLLILVTVFVGIAKVNGLKSEINQREELIGYLQTSADTIKQLRNQQQSSRGGADINAPLPTFVDVVLNSAGLDHGKVEVGSERPGTEDKETRETLLEVKLTQINLRQLQRFLFVVTDMGSVRGLNIKDLIVDTKGDPSGYIDASVTLASYKAK